jgi:hypothetical protein
VVADVAYTDAGTWLRLSDGEGKANLALSGEDIGGEPFGAFFSPDGHMVEIFVFETADGDATSASEWHLVEVDPVDGTHRDTGMAGSLPATTGERVVNVSGDRATAVFWARGDDTFPPALLTCTPAVRYRWHSPRATRRSSMSGISLRSGPGVARRLSRPL